VNISEPLLTQKRGKQCLENQIRKSFRKLRSRWSTFVLFLVLAQAVAAKGSLSRIPNGKLLPSWKQRFLMALWLAALYYAKELRKELFLIDHFV
jgi:hypothetical protein